MVNTIPANTVPILFPLIHVSVCRAAERPQRLQANGSGSASIHIIILINDDVVFIMDMLYQDFYCLPGISHFNCV